VHVSGVVPAFVQEIVDGAPDTSVHVEAVVRSNVVPLDVPCATKVCCPPAVPLTVQVRGVLPLEQEVVFPNVPSHTSKFVTLGRKTVSVAVLLTLCEAAVMTDVPAATPCIVALPHVPVAQVPVRTATVGVALDHDTPLVKVLPTGGLSLSTPNADNVIVDPSGTDGAVGLIVIEAKVGFTKNPLQPAPKASATRAVKAISNASLRPVNINIDYRLR